MFRVESDFSISLLQELKDSVDSLLNLTVSQLRQAGKRNGIVNRCTFRNHKDKILHSVDDQMKPEELSCKMTQIILKTRQKIIPQLSDDYFHLANPMTVE